VLATGQLPLAASASLELLHLALEGSYFLPVCHAIIEREALATKLGLFLLLSDRKMQRTPHP